MSQSKMTILSFSDYMEANGTHLFSEMKLPTGINRDILIKNILINAGDFELLYSNPYFMQEAIGVWSQKWERTFKRWVEVLNIDYDPLSNYDRHEEWTDNNHRWGNGNGTITNNSNGWAEINNHDSTLNSKSAYDSNELQTDTASKVDMKDRNDSHSDGTTTDHHDNDDTELLIKTGRAWGNIGVTTSQQMLESELSISAWNLYEQITDLFVQEFCIMVY